MSRGMETLGETNTVVAAVCFLSGLVIDALTALDPPTPTEAPTAMRSSAVVLIACLASPPIRERMVFSQRLAIVVPLLLVGLVGWHESGTATRVGDALYTALTLGACIAAFLGGDGNRLQRKVSSGAAPYLKREALASLAASILFYSSVRLIRHAFRLPVNVAEYRVASVSFDGTVQYAVGYASSNSVASAALALGAVAGTGAACVLGANMELRSKGTAAATLVLASSAILQLAAALVATLAAAHPLVHLPAIWSDGACGDASCTPSNAARRFAVMNGSTASLWVNGVGTLLMAYAPSLRLKTRAEQESTKQDFELTVYGAGALIVCVVMAVSQLSFTGADAITDYSVVAAVVSVFVTAFLDQRAGPLLFLIAISADVVLMYIQFGISGVFGHLTHCLNATMLIILSLYLILTTTVDVLWRRLPTKVVDFVDNFTGLMVVAGTSLAALLFFGSVALYATYDGALIDQRQYRSADRRFERTVAIFIAEHFLPLLVFLPLYSCRCEAEQLGISTRTKIWHLAPIFPLAVWSTVLFTSDLALNHAQEWIRSLGFLVGVCLVGVAPWLAMVWA